MKRVMTVTGLLSVLLLLMMMVGGRTIYGWFTDQSRQDNTLSVGMNEVEIEEEFPDPELKPGEKIKKEVTFTNTGRGPMYVRACCLFSSKEAEEGARLLMGSSRWELAEDGYYYYTDIVNPKERTEVLLYGLTWESEEEITDFDLTVYTESVQAAGHENSREAFAHLMEREEGQEK